MKIKIKDNKMKRQAKHREDNFAKQVFDKGLVSTIHTKLLNLIRN